MSLQFDEAELVRLKWILDADEVPAAEALGFSSVATTGSGPFSEAEFDALLRSQRFEVFFPRQVPEELEVLIVGRWDWDEGELELLLEEKAGKTLRVYSQELFVAFLVAGIDPLDEDESKIRELAGEHSALAFLEDVGFDWPSTRIVGTGKRPPDIVAPERGFLRSCGYRVGKQSVGRARRRLALRRVYDSHVPSSLAGAEYAAEWGQPRTCKRLEKMAVTIASLCRGQKRKSEPARLAIKHWEEDLDWLKSEYYKGRCRFTWPKTEVR